MALAISSSGQSEELLSHLLSSVEAAAKPHPPSFDPTVGTCNSAEVLTFIEDQTPPDNRTAARQRANMRGLVEVTDTFRKLGVPVFVLSGMLLGWRRGCFAVAGDADADLGTFGPWVADVGMQRLHEVFGAAGHTLETQYCQDGPLTAGCELRVTLSGIPDAQKSESGVPYVDIEMLFSAPPVSVGRMPGRFDRCTPDVCGRNCERCPFAYSLWSGDLSHQDRFYSCPVPVGKFRLAAWMNRTFWVPTDVEGYLRAEYGEKWPSPVKKGEGWPTYRPCQPYMDKDISFSQYPSYIPGLPSASEVLKAQSDAEAREEATIASAADFELETLWDQGGAQAAARSGPPPWEPQQPKAAAHAASTKAVPAAPVAARHPWFLELCGRFRFLLAAVAAVVAVALCALLGWHSAKGDGCCCMWLFVWMEARRLGQPKD